MAPLDQHLRDCLKFLGDEFLDVNRWMDECFREFGPYHRHARHHREGIKEVVDRFGIPAGRAAAIHILRDCRHIPSRREYKLGLVDALGLKRNWSTSAYIRYNDQDFEALVKEHLKPTALVLWAHLEWSDVVVFLSSATQLDEDEIAGLEPDWKKARALLSQDGAKLIEAEAVMTAGSATEADEDSFRYLSDILRGVSSTLPEGKNASIAYISVEALTSPLVYIDYELLEDLKPELSGSSPAEIAEFSFPKRIGAPMVAVGDNAQQSVTFISRQKSVVVSPVRLRQTEEGTEVSYVVSASSSGIVVGKFGDRYVLRNGIHRAYLLAQLGHRRIPCIVVEEEGQIPVVSTAYPTFGPITLMQPRHPMLYDLFKPELCLQIALRRTNRVIRISADSTNLPVE